VASFNKQNIDFARQALLNKISRSVPCIALYPKNSSDTKLLVLANSTTVNIRYIASTTSTYPISYVGKSIETVVQEINALNIPIRALALSEIEVLSNGDLISTGGSYSLIPGDFTVHDRITERGVVLRCKKIAIKHKSSSKIKLLTPYLEDPSLPWYPRILNGSFSQKYKGDLYHFYITEFDKQAWSPVYGKPFKDLNGIQPSYVDVGVYQLPRFPVYWNGENIVVYNGKVPVSSNVVTDIDINNGLLYLDSSFNPGENFSLDYTYLETSFVYKGVNINGHFSQNPYILDKYVVIYMIPAESRNTINKQTIFHVIGDSVDQAISNITLEDPSLPVAIIGAYNIQQLFSSDKISILDTRSKGGGLKRINGPVSPVHHFDNVIESNEVPIENIYQESYRFWDIGNIDGEAYPGAAAIAVDLPEDLQEILPINDIKAKATKFAAAGVYPSIKFTRRPLPSISGAAQQVSCTYNENLEEIFTRSYSGYTVLDTIDSTVKGIGWSTSSVTIPNIYTGNWDNFSLNMPIQSTENTKVIRVSTDEEYYTSYLKGIEIAGISWEERELNIITGQVSEIIYTPWKEKRILDFKEVATGQLSKSYFVLKNPGSIKEYKNIKIHSPYKTGDLTSLVKDELIKITSNILEQRESNNQVDEVYSSVDKSTTNTISDYVLSPYIYNNLFDILETDLRDIYSGELVSIGKSIQSGTYTSGHYFKYYLHNTDSYVAIGDNYPPVAFDCNTVTRTLSKYLNYRRKTNWDSDDQNSFQSMTGLISSLVNSKNSFGDFGPGIPFLWLYTPKFLTNGITNSYFSGAYLPSVFQLGGNYGEISPLFNFDYIYTRSLPFLFSSLEAYSGETYSPTYEYMYSLTNSEVIPNIDLSINGDKTLSGLPISSHWYVSHNRLGTYLGNVIYDITKTYDSLANFNKQREHVSDVSSLTGMGYSALTTIFNDIETVLDKAHDSVYNNLLRGGVVEPSIALAIYGYGWYINNWSNHYGIVGKTYTKDYRQKFDNLFDFGLKQLIKDQINEQGDLLETTVVNHNRAPFGDNVPYKLLYALGEAVKHDTSWKGVTEGYIKTLINSYSVDGLYYVDPYKKTSTCGKEIDIYPGLISVYKNLTTLDTGSKWEPINSTLDNLRGAFFRPDPVGNTLNFWKNYDSGAVETSLSLLKQCGINTITLPLDYMYWRYNPTGMFSNLEHLLDTCSYNKVRLIPSVIEDNYTYLNTGAIESYVTGNTVGYYSYSGYLNQAFMTGFGMGETYVRSLINSFDNHPGLLAWNIVNNPAPYAASQVLYNSIAYILDNYGNSPIMYTPPYHITKADTLGIRNSVSTPFDLLSAGRVYIGDTHNLKPTSTNPRISFLGISPNSLFSKFIDLSSYTGNIVLYNYGNSMYSDYETCVDRAVDKEYPIIFSNLEIASGYRGGVLYKDGSSRNLRQVKAIQDLAISQGAKIDSDIYQRRNFDGFSFYPDFYKPSYKSFDLIEEISDWSFNHLPSNSGEFLRKVDILETTSEALNALNHRNNNLSSYTVNKIYTNYEGDVLNNYITEWNNRDYVKGGSAWTVSGKIDYDRYNSYLENWGKFLYTLITKLNIDG
jgi:hypothetical protein